MMSEEKRLKRNAYMRAWCKNNPEKVKRWRRLYYLRNKEAFLRKMAEQRRRRDPEKARLYFKEYARTRRNRNVEREYRRRWRLRNREKLVADRHRRVWRGKTDITPEFVAGLFAETKTCPLCFVELENHGRYPNGKHLDHIKPLNVGGLHVRDNVRCICSKCNISRPHDGRDVVVKQMAA